MKKGFLHITVMTLLMVYCLFVSAGTFPVPYSEKIDITKQNRVLSLVDIEVNVSMSRPAAPFKIIRFAFLFTRNKKPFFPERAELRFNMKMDMGDYRSRLTRQGNTYKAKAMLPKCMKGGKRWFVKLSVDVDGKTLSTVFLFDLE
jgi:hypothetical protein